MAWSKETRDAARRAGFNPNQIDFLETFMAESGHGHEIEDIDGLAELIEESEEDEDEEEE